ncbi:MAG: hypothetical protein WCK93_07700 [Nitrosomonadales bacterium]|jgi:hypothetical protein
MIDILTIGYIPSDWQGNVEGGQVVEIGNPDFSNTKEVTFKIIEGSGYDIENLTIGDWLKHESPDVLAKLVKDIGGIIGAGFNSEIFRVVYYSYITGELGGIVGGMNTGVDFLTAEGVEINVNKKNKNKIYVHGYDEKNEHDYISLLKVKNKR